MTELSAASELARRRLVEDLVSELGNEKEPLSVKEGIDRYLQQKQGDVKEVTLMRYELCLSELASLCEEAGIDDLSELSEWLQQEGVVPRWSK